VSERRAAGWIDASVPLDESVSVWPGDPRLVLERIARLDVDGVNVSRLLTSVHVGTHVDAPVHYFADGAGVDTAPLAVLIGRVRVVDCGDADVVTASSLRPLRVRHDERVLLRTRNSSRRWWAEAIRYDFACLTPAAAELLGRRGARLVGIDGPSVGAAGSDGDKVHRTLLAAGVWIVEGLDLAAVLAGRYDMACLPLRLVGADGAPARVVLRPLAPARGRATAHRVT